MTWCLAISRHICAQSLSHTWIGLHKTERFKSLYMRQANSERPDKRPDIGNSITLCKIACDETDFEVGPLTILCKGRTHYVLNDIGHIHATIAGINLWQCGSLACCFL